MTTKYEAHLWFDKLWRNHSEREYYYQKLADELGIPKDQCHFSKMSDEMRELAMVYIKKWWWEKYDR